MSELVLSRDEVRDLCRTRLRVGQAKFLRQNGIRHYLDAHGWPANSTICTRTRKTRKRRKKKAPRKALEIWRPRSELNRRTRICSPHGNPAMARIWG